MSYEKARKHARNVRKSRKQGRMHFGFSTGSGSWPSPHAEERECPVCKFYRSRVYFDRDGGPCDVCQRVEKKPGDVS